MYSHPPPTNAPRYAPNEESIPHSDINTSYNPQVLPPFQALSHNTPASNYSEPVAKPITAHSTTSDQLSSAYPQNSNRYEYASSAPAQSYGNTSPSNPATLLSYLRNLNEKDKKRLYWIAAFVVVGTILLILFEVYRSDFETWIQPATRWLTAHDSWSWTIPTVVLIILSFPPLFGHEIVMLFVGLAYPIAVGIGISCAGAILGEAACFVVFKYFFTSYVDKKIAQSVRWAATARISQEAGFRGVLIIRYSIVPPHLANPLFSCTGMPFWLYMSTVILSLPKTIIFVILSSPDLQNSTGAKVGKYAAITVLVIITIFASRWIGRKSRVMIKQIEAERARAHGDDETQEMLRGEMNSREGLASRGYEMGRFHQNDSV